MAQERVAEERGRRVLIAEDEALIRLDLREMLVEEGYDVPVSQYRAVAAPKGLPDDIAQKLTSALKQVYDSAEFKDFMNQRGFGMVYASGEQFGTFMSESNDSLGKVMKAVGIARQ